MRQGPNNNKRMRGRGNGRKSSTPRNQTFESNGPDVKVRGNAQQVVEKYLTLARDATSAGDRIAAENYYQFAEHYYRVMNANAAHEQRQASSQDDNSDDSDQDSFDQSSDQGYDNQPDDRGYPDRSQGDRQQSDRQDRQQADRQPQPDRQERQQSDRQDRQQADRQQPDRQPQPERQQNAGEAEPEEKPAEAAAGSNGTGNGRRRGRQSRRRDAEPAQHAEAEPVAADGPATEEASEGAGV